MSQPRQHITDIQVTGRERSGMVPPKNLMASSPVGATLPGLKNFYYTSHWSIPGGGVPSALKSAHDLAQIIEDKLYWSILMQRYCW